MENSLLAIVIPYYKISFFKETLQSLINQKDKRFKVYIGDDASPDSPDELIRQARNYLDIVYFRFDKNLGSNSLSKHWERCINLCRDESWLMLLGDDDILQSNVVDSWYKHFQNFDQKSNLIRFSTRIIDSLGSRISNSYEHPQWENSTDSYWRKFRHLSRSSLSEYIFKREIYNKFGFYDFPLAWNSDDWAWLQFSNHLPIYSINDAQVFVRLSDINISGINDNLEEKKQSEMEFFGLIIKEKLNFFKPKERRIVLLRKYESLLYDNETNPSFRKLCVLILKYISNFDKSEFVKFNKRIVRRYLIEK